MTLFPDGLHAALAASDWDRVHEIRQRYQRGRPSPIRPYEPGLEADLVTRGIVKYPTNEPSEFDRMRSNMTDFVASMNLEMEHGRGVFAHYDEEEHYWSDDQAYVSNNAFKWSPTLARIASARPLLEVVAGYLGAPFHVTRALATRYMPANGTGKEMFGWHHDMNDRSLKLMILLTDVGEADTEQHMSYVLGSNNLYHPLSMFRGDNTCSIAYCEKALGKVEKFRTTGPAGATFLFDPNGAHRGNRSAKGRLRDAFVVEYSTDRSQCWGGDVAHAFPHGEVPPPVFHLMMQTTPRWELPRTRKQPSWMENLPHPERWL